MPESVSFDRAASYYDRTRAMPSATAEAVTDAILRELRKAEADNLLEVGVGTGRISRPLMLRGQRVTGVDISSEMVAQLRPQLTPGHVQPDLLFGDATRLPLREDTFRAVLIVHVLHLVSDAEATIAEIKRVLSPGGVLLHKVQRDPEPLKAAGDWWDDALARAGHRPIRRLRFEKQHEMLAKTGASVEVIDVAEERAEHSPEDLLQLTRERVHSWTWQVEDETFATVFREHEPWFRAHYRGPIVEEITHELEVWRWPDA